ncbi:tripartite tricarboxylate transporter permease [Streptomyces sp. PSKA54]|uniref:Tripartite tricarboxylate transporter permease n=1 Tax=Streptomyces himalayensis subsp. aureolus TaxID=2758039 RepID=A0A7W2D1S2_9ACTN|nr:tripartite tricarboxylate transporter permease [Streptomyces himalayensis]MBA4863032.1 tripartite tricarboxylate transporter permease [Streptomyces himalayensis subsp. aureolus]
MIDNIVTGFGAALSAQNLLWCFVGVLLGTVIGILPGLGSATGVAILIPVTLTFEPLTALIMLAGIYHGAQFGATITAILIATPGEASSVVSTLDGYRMARDGRAGPALAISALGAFVAAMVSLVALAAVAPFFARLALDFGPPEMLAVMILGLCTIVVFSGRNIRLGMALGLVGVLIACIGVDVGSGTPRYTFGQISLFGGVPYVEVMIGLFAIGELLNQLHIGLSEPIRARFRDLLLTKEDLKRAAPATARGTVVGFLLGCLPGAGTTLASFMAYGAEKKFSRNRRKLGTGAIEGVVAPDAATNAASNANFVPTLVLGVPGGATTAVLLGAFLIYGIQPGPLLFENQPDLVWGLLASFFIGNVILLVLNLPLAPVLAQLLRVRYAVMYPLIIVTSLIGAYSVKNSMLSVWIVIFFGLVGYAMKRLSLPVAPLVLGLVVGPLFEKALVQTSALGAGDATIMLSSPTALVILGLALALVAGPALAGRLLPRRRPAAGAGQEPADALDGAPHTQTAPVPAQATSRSTPHTGSGRSDPGSGDDRSEPSRSTERPS